MRISYTLDASTSAYTDPVTWTAMDQTGTLTHTLHKTDPAKQQVHIDLILTPPCSGFMSRTGKVTQDMGAMTPTRIYQIIDMGCTKCQ